MRRRAVTIALGRAVKRAAALRGGGSAFPGLVMERIDPRFVPDALAGLPYGVLVISGTNGKTTTTKMVTEVLSSCGLRAVTNRTGSNFVRGVAAALLSEVDSAGRLPHDIAILELDEAHAVRFTRQTEVRHVLVLNVMRDQLDRFGEIDRTASLLEEVARSARVGVVLNRDDPRVARFADVMDPRVDVRYFGVSADLRSVFVNDDQLHASDEPASSDEEQRLLPADVELREFSDRTAVYGIGSESYAADMNLTGVYNFLNAAAALALCRAVLGGRVADRELVAAVSRVEPAFGRGETVHVAGRPLELVLVKNPAGFRLALASFSPQGTAVMIAINDNFADGRDMSWLWDVDFSSLRAEGVSAVSGERAYDMALRLQYDDVPVKAVEPDLKAALARLLESSGSSQRSRVFCTYTAMLELRRVLRGYTEVATIS